MKVFTIGHSTRSLAEFVALLDEFGVTQLVDIRTVPGSRHNPQYSKANLTVSLPEHGISYVHLAGLGGLRKTKRDSVNQGWRNASFRGYADYLQTEEFSAALAELLALAEKATTAIMCAEAVPWRCHRSLVGDALLIRGVEVYDIMGPGKATPQQLTKFARVDGLKLTYPG